MPWPEVVRLIGEIRKHNPVTSVSSGGAQVLNNALDMNEMNDEVGRVVRPKLDAHDIAKLVPPEPCLQQPYPSEGKLSHRIVQ